jgi:hypothetical protein
MQALKTASNQAQPLPKLPAQTCDEVLTYFQRQLSNSQKQHALSQVPVEAQRSCACVQAGSNHCYPTPTPQVPHTYTLQHATGNTV